MYVICRVRTCAGYPMGFQVPRLNHSAKMTSTEGMICDVFEKRVFLRTKYKINKNHQKLKHVVFLISTQEILFFYFEYAEIH